MSVALRIRRQPRAFAAPLWFSSLCVALMPTSIGYQDLAGFLARQPGVSERWREHLIASPFGTIHAATFSFSRPIGTAMPSPFGAQPASFDPRSLNVKSWSTEEPMVQPALYVEYPIVNRRLKGDRMPAPQGAPASGAPEHVPPLQPIEAPASRPSPPPAPTVAPPWRPKDAEQLAPGAATADRSDGEVDDAINDVPPELPAAGERESRISATSSFASLGDADAAARSTQLYFGVGTMGEASGLQRWEPGAAPVLALPSTDPDMKVSALAGSSSVHESGETVADKGDASRFKSPALRLGLAGKSRAKAEKCVADAVYFEARGEPLRGQMAVAQVVMNRVFSGRYPNDVCGVVYQNADHHLACQFTFACEGKDLSRIDEPDVWEQAKRIAKDALDGKFWLNEVGHATHYHADWVRPSWVNEMAKLYKLGVHIFYRPRAWGDGSDAPVWSNGPQASANPAAATKAADAAKLPQATSSSPAPAAGTTRTAGL